MVPSIPGYTRRTELMLFARDFMTDQIVLRASGAPKQPMVSVVLPTYARGQNGMLKRALASVLAQTMKDLELLVIDDGSKDGSYELIEEFRQQDPRVIHVRHECNSGIHSVRLNEGIALARGQYIAFQFDDDNWRPHALETLMTEAARHRDPVVAVGHAQFHGSGGRWRLPAVELNLVNLYEQNRFANNAVLLPRELIDQFGMYDCHIGMRRLCDWDLWLRYMKHVPFVVVDEVISDVFESNPGSLGLTVPYDLPLFRYFQAIARDRLLTPERWLDYEVDALCIAGVEIDTAIRSRLYEEQIAPYYMKFRHQFQIVEGFRPTLLPARKTVLLTKQAYDVSNDVTLNHYDALANSRGSYKAYFQPLQQVGSTWAQEADALLLVRTVEDKAKSLMYEAVANNVPLGLYLDDDLLAFHEYGPQYDYIAPGTPYHRNLTEIASGVDAVWVTNEHLATSMRTLNPRVIPHNNAIPKDWLPITIRPRTIGQPVRIGYVGSAYRVEEFRLIWDALLALSQEHRDQLQFEFWGLDPSSLPSLHSPVTYRPYTFSYFYYLRQLRTAGFDLLLSPLIDHPRPRLAKSLIKYYETAVAGALGIFSDGPQYRQIPDGLTCLKAENTAQAWYAALRHAISMPAEHFDLMRRRALEHVREEHTEVAQIDLHEAAWRATEFHAKTRTLRHVDGRPRVIYVFHSAHFGGAETVLWRRVWTARQYGIAPIVVLPRVLQHSEAAQQLQDKLQRERIQVEFIDYICFDVPSHPDDFRSDLQRAEIRDLFERCSPALVHTATFIPSFGQMCDEMHIPHVASLYAIEDSFEWVDKRPRFHHCSIAQSDTMRYATRWSDLLGAEKFCAREIVPADIFALGQKRYLQTLNCGAEIRTPRRMVVAGTFQKRKSQLEIIEVLGAITREGWDCHLDFYGYTHFFPQYVQHCRKRADELHLNERIAFHDFEADMTKVLESADIVLSLSTYESLPTIIKEAMAAGVLVVATPIGGIPEIIVDGVTGILCKDISLEAMTEGARRALEMTNTERDRIIQQARRVARTEFHPYRATNDLMMMYNRAIDLTRAHSGGTGLSRASLTVDSKTNAYPHVESPSHPPLGHLQVGHGLSYQLTPQRDHWAGISLLLGTNQRRADGKLNMRIRASSGHVLRECEADLTGVVDNNWLDFRFPSIANTAGELFVLDFRLSDASRQTLISLYETTPPDSRAYRVLRRAGVQWIRNSLYCSLRYGD